MAPQAPLTSNPTEHTTLKTPDAFISSHEAKAGESTWSQRYRFVGNAAQLLIFASIGLFIFGQLIYFTPIYSSGISVTLKEWWSVPVPPATTGNGEASTARQEKVLPTFFLLFAMLPLLVSAWLIEFLRHFNLRRISSHYMLKFTRRKPALFGKVSTSSYGEWIFFLGVIGGNMYVFCHFYVARIERMKTRITGEPKFKVYLEAVALMLGFVCIFNLAFLFLPATRNCAWMEFFNVSYANGIKYHRWLGVATVVTGLLHCAGYYGLKVWFNVFGEIALLIFLVIGFTSIPVIRRKFYNVFYYSHQLLFPAVIFSVMHWASIVWWIFPTFIIYCFSCAMSMSSNFAPVQVSELTAIADDLVKVVIKRSPGRDDHYRVGQFLYLNVPAISKLQWHAFTISSSPRSSDTTVTVLLKSLGDWTQDLATHANACRQKNILPTVYVDGFYGASLEMYDEYATVCLVGGGIGATLMFAILEDLVAKLANHEPLAQKVVFIFSFRKLALLDEVHPVLVRLKELDPQEKYFRMHLFWTRVPSDGVLAQRIDTDRLLGRHVLPTEYEGNAAPMASIEPLRSRTYRAVAMASVVTAVISLVVYLHYGGDELKRIDPALWPLQHLLESCAVIVAGAVVFIYVAAERMSKHNDGSGGSGASKEMEMNSSRVVHTTLTNSDVHTYADLLVHYNVAVSERPDTKDLMARVHFFHSNEAIRTTGKPMVSVFVSGLEAMKRVVDYSAHEIGTRHFDIHEEEFEL